MAWSAERSEPEGFRRVVVDEIKEFAWLFGLVTTLSFAGVGFAVLLVFTLKLSV